jgi:hypothetical protein
LQSQPKKGFQFFSNALNKKIKTPDTQANDKKENEIHGRQGLQLLDRQNASW